MSLNLDLMIRKISAKYSIKIVSNRKFSAVPKVDKTKNSGGLFGLFETKYLSKPVFNLSHEVTDFFINNSQYLVKEFPFLGQDSDILVNFTCLHFVLIKERLVTTFL